MGRKACAKWSTPKMVWNQNANMFVSKKNARCLLRTKGVNKPKPNWRIPCSMLRDSYLKSGPGRRICKVTIRKRKLKR